jgi:hypothetical protein
MKKENEKARESLKFILEQIVDALKEFNETNIEQTLIFDDAQIVISSLDKKSTELRRSVLS